MMLSSKTSAEIAQSSFQLRKAEVVTILFQTGGIDSLPFERDHGLLSQDNTDEASGHGQDAGPVQYPRQGFRKFFLGDWLGCGHVVDALNASRIGVGHEM